MNESPLHPGILPAECWISRAKHLTARAYLRHKSGVVIIKQEDTKPCHALSFRCGTHLSSWYFTTDIYASSGDFKDERTAYLPMLVLLLSNN